MTGTKELKKRQRGDASDVMKAWQHYYQKQGWDKIARFDSKGRLGTPYLLFKAKNIIDPEVRKSKWFKARPIAPIRCVCGGVRATRCGMIRGGCCGVRWPRRSGELQMWLKYMLIVNTCSERDEEVDVEEAFPL